MKVLHITNWFPTKKFPFTAIWTLAQINSLPKDINSEVIHVEVGKGAFAINWNQREIHGNKKFVFKSRVLPWRLLEIIAFVYLYVILKRKGVKDYDLVNFHIAYPNLVYFKRLRKLIPIPVVITEHWSAYHYNFGVSSDKNLIRIIDIFQFNIPVIAVSQSLLSDIRKFSNCDFPGYVVPNIVDERYFYPDDTMVREKFFFMVSNWQWPKRPLVAINAFNQFIQGNQEFKLVIAGHGRDYINIEKYIDKRGLKGSILVFQSLSPKSIGDYMRSCSAFIHASEYETFSVVCAEARACKTPILASRVGGLIDVVDEKSGILIDGFDDSIWLNGMEAIVNFKSSQTDYDKYYPDNVGKQMNKVYDHVLINETGE